VEGATPVVDIFHVVNNEVQLSPSHSINDSMPFAHWFRSNGTLDTDAPPLLPPEPSMDQVMRPASDRMPRLRGVVAGCLKDGGSAGR
jgi:hypothetical protein